MTHENTTTQILHLPNVELQWTIWGPNFQHIPLINTHFDVTVRPDSENVHITGSEAQVSLAAALIQHLYNLFSRSPRTPFSTQELDAAISSFLHDPSTSFDYLHSHVISAVKGATPIRPRSPQQAHYLDLITNSDLVFGIGPAGTGKTFLAMTMALSMFYKRTIKKIIITRPAVEAGEHLGFLPGDLMEKIDPYLQPLYDALFTILDPLEAQQLIQYRAIEVAPLAFMRGRTLDNAFVILDEAQNTSRVQMKMFLTRIGHNSKTVITGDLSQIDLPNPQNSGLLQARSILKNIDGISFCEFSTHDVVRHPLVKKIIDAYAAS